MPFVSKGLYRAAFKAYPMFKQKMGIIRFNSTNTTSGSNSILKPLIALTTIGGGGFAAYYYYNNSPSPFKAASPAITAETATFDDYQKVYNAISQKLIDEDEYDDGSYAPVLLRLAWHSSGTFDKATKTGGSYGGTMRFKVEGNDGANNGLDHARNFLEPIKEKNPWLSYGDLWTLGGVAAVQEMQGPKIPWRAGRVDQDETKQPPLGRLPDASKGSKHIRDIFYRMGFNDQQIVALMGAHALGRCHTDRSGFDGPWTFSPITFTNDFYKLLVDEKWQWRKWDGPAQYEDVKTKSLMMLPTDYEMIKDKSFKQWTIKYANDVDLFFHDFSTAYSKLLELGVPFKPDTPQWEFKTLDEQES